MEFTYIVPRVIRVMLVSVGPSICQEDLASIPNIGKGIENMGKFFTSKILGVKVATINSLQGLSVVGFVHLEKRTNPIDKVSNILVT